MPILLSCFFLLSCDKITDDKKNTSVQTKVKSATQLTDNETELPNSKRVIDSIIKIRKNFKCDIGTQNMVELNECYLKEKKFLIDQIESYYQLLRLDLKANKDLLRKLENYHASWQQHLILEREFISEYYESFLTNTRSIYDIRAHFIGTYENKLSDYIILHEALKEEL